MNMANVFTDSDLRTQWLILLYLKSLARMDIDQSPQAGQLEVSVLVVRLWLWLLP